MAARLSSALCLPMLACGASHLLPESLAPEPDRNSLLYEQDVAEMLQLEKPPHSPDNCSDSLIGLYCEGMPCSSHASCLSNFCNSRNRCGSTKAYI